MKTVTITLLRAVNLRLTEAQQQNYDLPELLKLKIGANTIPEPLSRHHAILAAQQR